MPEPDFDKDQFIAHLQNAVTQLQINSLQLESHLSTCRAQIAGQDEQIATLTKERDEALEKRNGGKKKPAEA